MNRVRLCARVRRLPCLVVAGLLVIGGSLPLHAQLDPKSVIARIEGPQVPDRGGLDGLSIPQLMQRLSVPGVSIAVIKDFRVEWVKTYGVADVESGRPVDSTTAFQAASISKPVTAMAAMRLAQDQRLRLDDDINTVLKSWRVPSSDLTRSQPVTARSLMSHTSGADDGFGFPGYDPSAPRPTLVQILNGQAPSNVGNVSFGRLPYQGFKYSGGGTVIVQLALMDLTGTPFAEFMQATVLGPLGMTNSTYEQPMGTALAAHAARAHNGEGRRMPAPWHVYPEQAAAGLWTTPTDLAQFVVEVQSAVRGPKGRVLTQTGAREMVAPVGTGPYAVGLAIGKRGEGWYFSHGGANWGFRADILGHLRKGYGIVVMTNGDAGTALITEIEGRVAAAYGWDSLDKPLVR
ncbi:MAG: serine hydrolase [Gemmatimonadetes bacterium]|nr:MAG: serine hydrolase [Gemmatimonadota bacterium]